jgi:hypothetical protein
MLRVCDFFQFARKVALKTKGVIALECSKIDKSHKLRAKQSIPAVCRRGQLQRPFAALRVTGHRLFHFLW